MSYYPPLCKTQEKNLDNPRVLQFKTFVRHKKKIKIIIAIHNQP